MRQDLKGLTPDRSAKWSPDPANAPGLGRLSLSLWLPRLLHGIVYRRIGHRLTKPGLGSIILPAGDGLGRCSPGFVTNGLTMKRAQRCRH